MTPKKEGKHITQIMEEMDIPILAAAAQLSTDTVTIVEEIYNNLEEQIRGVRMKITSLQEQLELLHNAKGTIGNAVKEYVMRKEKPLDD